MTRWILSSFAAVAACGGDDPARDAAVDTDAEAIDAATPDATADATLDADPARALDVVVGRPVLDDPTMTVIAQVHLIDPDGTLRPPQTSPGDTTVRFDDVAPESTVVVYWPGGAGTGSLRMIVGVDPGERVEIVGLPFYQPWVYPPPVATTQASWTAYPGAQAYTLVDPCAETRVADVTSTAVEIREGCEGGTADLALFALNDDYLMIAATRLAATPFVGGEPITFGAWTPTHPVAIHGTGYPAAATSTSTEVREWFGDYFPSLTSAESVTGIGDRIVAETSASLADFQYQRHGVLVAPDATELDLPYPTFPWVTSVVKSIAERQVHWETDADTTAVADGILVSIRNDTFNASILLPPGTTTWEWGALPEPIRSYVTPLPALFGVQVFDFAEVDGYADLRRREGSLWGCPVCNLIRGFYFPASLSANRS